MRNRESGMVIVKGVFLVLYPDVAGVASRCWRGCGSVMREWRLGGGREKLDNRQFVISYLLCYSCRVRSFSLGREREG